MERLKVQDPFQTASAKSAMKEASRRAQQYEQRYANMMGANVNPEAMIASKQATQEAVAGTAGNIAVGAEAQKAAGLARLRGERAGQLLSSAQLKSRKIEELGQGWRDFFQILMPAIGGTAEGLGTGMQGAGSVGMAAAGAGGGGSAASLAPLVAAASDISIKENVRFIGELQGQKIYKYNFKGSPVVHIGVIAQEIEKSNPDMVIEDGDILKVYYDKVFKTVPTCQK